MENHYRLSSREILPSLPSKPAKNQTTDGRCQLVNTRTSYANWTSKNVSVKKRISRNEEGGMRDLKEAIEPNDLGSALLVSVSQWLLRLRSLFGAVHVSNNRNSHRHHAVVRKGHSSVVDLKVPREPQRSRHYGLILERLQRSTSDLHLQASPLYKDRAKQYRLPYTLETAPR